MGRTRYRKLTEGERITIEFLTWYGQYGYNLGIETDTKEYHQEKEQKALQSVDKTCPAW